MALTLGLSACGGGQDGAAGPPGEPGTDGTDGTNGADGANGVDGADGVNGVDGVNGADGAQGDAGLQGEPGVSTAAVSGTITSSATSDALVGATITFDPPAIEPVTTGSTGGFDIDALPIGVYTVTISADGYATATATLSVVAGVPATLDVALTPSSGVVVSAGADVSAAPGATRTLTASASVLDGSTGATYSWVQTAGVPVTLSGTDTATLTATLPARPDYKMAVITEVNAPDRTMVLGVSPYALEEGSHAEFQVTVTTSSGSYTDKVAMNVDTGLAVSTGLRNVPIGVPVLLQAKQAASYNWTLTPPTGSTATVQAASRYPTFTPDVAGPYTLTVNGETLEITAGEWVGAISGVGTDGRPLAASCTGCHREGSMAPDKFTAWRQSGHAEIFTQNIENPAGHYGENCVSCHTVGHDPSAVNGGFDEAMAEEGYEVPSHGAPGDYAAMFADFPKTAKLANIQCENCHGPNGSDAHTAGDGSRISYASELCGSCHGEPLRHGRYQQWQEAGHASFEYTAEATVEERGTSAAHCGRCHSAQGYIAWSAQGDFSKRIQGDNGDATVAELTAMGLTHNEVQPQTCVTCHDPHQQGTTSGEPNTASVRVQDNTGMLPSGFAATGVGVGALCMTCHNTRNGLRNDASPPTSYGGPHAPSQTDVLMGQNAFFVTTGIRGAHSYIENTCATCHMELTPPPEEFSYNGAGTNHSFRATMDICVNCHGDFNGGGIQAGTQQALADLESWIAGQVRTILNARGTIWVRAEDTTTEFFSSASDSVANVQLDLTANPITAVIVTSSHGQQIADITLTTPISIRFLNESGALTAPKSMSMIGVELRSFYEDAAGAQGARVFAQTGNLVKANWNVMLLRGDASLGVHNPTFYNEVIAATRRQNLSL